MDRQAKHIQQIIPLRQSSIKLPKPAALQLIDKPFLRFCRSFMMSTVHTTSLTTLRSQQGFNANVLMYLCWQSLQQHGRFKQVDVRYVLQHIVHWRESVIRPLEYLVQDLQSSKVPTATEIGKHVELELQQAEIVEQCLLADIHLQSSYMPRSLEQQLQDMCHAVATYAKVLSAKLLADDIELFVKLFQGLLPNICPKKVAQVVRDKLQKVATDFDYAYSQLPLNLAV